VTRRALSAAAVALSACVLVAWWPVGASAGGAGACLRLPQARVIYNNSEVLIVRSRPRRAYYGCLKQGGKPVRIDRRLRERVLLVYPPAGRFVATKAAGPSKRCPSGIAGRLWLIVTDLRTGAEYRVFKSFLFEDCCGSIVQVVLRDTGSVAFQTSYSERNLCLYACEPSTCYDKRRYGRYLRVLDRAQGGGFYDVRLDGATVRWTNTDIGDGQEKSADLE